MIALLVCVVCLSWCTQSTSMNAPGEGDRPHIVMLLADDLGWASVGWHQPEGAPRQEIQTPNLDGMLKNGIELDRAYVMWECAPTRSSLQSGRLPVHEHYWKEFLYIKDTADGGGMPRKMTGMAEHLKRAGYATHFVGKWHAGFATFEQLPINRGYDTSFGFLANHINPWTDESGFRSTREHFYDRWEDDHPAPLIDRPLPPAAADLPAGVVGEEHDYQEFQTKTRVLDIITNHDQSTPLFLCYCFRMVHEPLYVPIKTYESIGPLPDEWYGWDRLVKGRLPVRRLYAACVKYMDEIIGEVHAKLVEQNMWSNTFLVFMSDNGGSSFYGGDIMPSSNYPLKGGKGAAFEGGVRSAAFVAGGFVHNRAPQRIGTKLDGYMHICDWYATFAALAGVDPTDQKAKEHNLPEIDSLNLWPYLSGAVDSSPRNEIFIAEGTLIQGKYKIMEEERSVVNGKEKVVEDELSQGCWSGLYHPNSSFPSKYAVRRMHEPDSRHTGLCARKEPCAEHGCLYNIIDDPGEHYDLSKSHPELFQELYGRLKEVQKSVFQWHVSKSDGWFNGKLQATWKAQHVYNHHWGPFAHVQDSLLESNVTVAPMPPLASLLK